MVPPGSGNGASPLNSETGRETPTSGTLASAGPSESQQPRPPASERPHGGTPLEELILARLDDDKAQDMVFIDLRDKSSIADAMIVASGRSHRHVGALADHLLRALKDEGHGKCRVEGMPHNDWVLIDAGDLIIHLFRPEVRAFYNIEKIWAADAAHRTQAAAQ